MYAPQTSNDRSQAQARSTAAAASELPEGAARNKRKLALPIGEMTDRRDAYRLNKKKLKN